MTADNNAMTLAPAELMPRAEVPVEHTWDTHSVFPSDEAWEAAFDAIEARLEELSGYRGRLGESAETLVTYLQLRDDTYNTAGKLMVYAGGFRAVDTMNQTAQAKGSRVGGLYARLGGATAFDEPEMLTIGAERIDAWMEANTDLSVYVHRFERLWLAAEHLLSGDEEALLALAGDPINTGAGTGGILTNAELPFANAVDSKGAEHEVAQSTIENLVTDRDRTLRESAWKNYADGYLGFKRTLANSLTVALKRDAFYAKARGYESSLEASLKPNQIPTEVFHNLLDVFQRNLPTWHRYWRLRKKAMGVDTLQPYDLKAPLTQDKLLVPFAQSMDWICEGMAPLDEDYVDIMRRGVLQDRWVDIYPNKGKTAGAFSSGVQGTHPFILVSYTDDLFSLSTLAHELGHSMHSYLSWQNQPFTYSRYSLFVAEVASNFNQAMVRAHLFATQPDPAFQIGLIEEAMSNFHRYFFIMPTLARFELETHQRVERGQPLTADGMNNLMADLFEEGYGGEVAMDRDRVGVTWAQFGHLYANFYVYQYATGIAGAHALADGVLNGEPGANERYLGFLKAGGSKYPLDALKDAGVDLTHPEPVEKAFAMLTDMVDRLETLLAG